MRHVAKVANQAAGVNQVLCTRRRGWRVVASVCVAMWMAQAGWAQAPGEASSGRTVKIVVPFGPGSGTDTATRMLAQRLEQVIRQPVVVENRPGANAVIASSAVAKAPADGLTLLMGTNSTHGANPGLVARLPHDPLKDFSAIGMAATFSSFLVVHPLVPVHTLCEKRIDTDMHRLSA